MCWMMSDDRTGQARLDGYDQHLGPRKCRTKLTALSDHVGKLIVIQYSYIHLYRYNNLLHANDPKGKIPDHLHPKKIHHPHEVVAPSLGA